MLPRLLAAALTVTAGISSGPAQPSSAMEQPAANSAPRRPFGPVDNAVSAPPQSGDYRLSESKASNGRNWSPDSGPTWLSQSLIGPEPLHGVRLRLRAKRLFDKFDLVGGGSGVGPPQYAGRKHLMLNILKSF